MSTSITTVASFLHQTVSQTQSSNTPIIPELGDDILYDNYIMLFLASGAFTENDATGHVSGTD